MKKFTSILLAILTVGAFCTFVSCDKGKNDPVILKTLVKVGNRTISYDNFYGRVTEITEHDGEDYSNIIFEYEGDTVTGLDEEKWGDWYQEPKPVYILTLGENGFAKTLIHKKDAGDVNYSFEYDAAGFLVKCSIDGEVVFTRVIENDNVVKYIQNKRKFEYGAEWATSEVANATMVYDYTDAKANIGNFYVDFPDFKRCPTNGDWKLEKLFAYSGLLGKASAKLPVSAVYTGSDIKGNFWERGINYTYTLDEKGYVASYGETAILPEGSTDEPETKTTELQWE